MTGDWLELAVEADREAVEAVAEILRAYGHGAVIDEPFFQPHLEDPAIPDLSRLPIVKTYVPEDASASAVCRAIEEDLWHVGQLRPVGPLRTRPIADADWSTAWKAYYPVQRVGLRMVVVPAWRRHRRGPDEIVVRLDPGLAFGTGSHPTTRLCLVAAEALVHRGSQVLDVGTGSGILAIAAARLGAARVIAMDIDPVAVAAARANIRLNHLSRVVRVFEGSPADLRRPAGQGAARLGRGVAALFRGRFDVVLANLTARGNIALAPCLASLLRPGGRLVASGILEENLDAVRDAFAAAGLETLEVSRQEDWVALTAARASSVNDRLMIPKGTPSP